MNAEADGEEPLLINGLRVDPMLLQAQAARRCMLEECQAHCCGGGVFIHLSQADDILAHQELILPHLPADRHDPARWFDGGVEPDPDHPTSGPGMGTAVVDDPAHPMGTCCVFLRPDRRCGLQAASIASGQHPWRFKPFYCALHPITLYRGTVILDAENEIYIEGGSCNRPNGAERIPWFRLFDLEMKLALGEEGYARLERMTPKFGA